MYLSFFSAGIFPNVPKVPKVIPVQKEDSKLDVSNYRPISWSSNIENILEKLIYYEIYKFSMTITSLSSTI